MALHDAVRPHAASCSCRLPPASRFDGARWQAHRVAVPIGFCFAAGTLAISVALRFLCSSTEDAGAIIAIATSIKTVLKNPILMTLWGLIVDAAALLIASLPFFSGLTVVVPVLGHALPGIFIVQSNRLRIPSRSSQLLEQKKRWANPLMT